MQGKIFLDDYAGKTAAAISSQNRQRNLFHAMQWKFMQRVRLGKVPVADVSSCTTAVDDWD